MKKKLCLLLSLVFSLFLATGCTTTDSLNMLKYSEGIANFYQYFITGYENGIELSCDTITNTPSINDKNTKINEMKEKANLVTALLFDKEYHVACIDKVSKNEQGISPYSFEVNGETKDFEIVLNSTSQQTINGKIWTQYKIYNGFKTLKIVNIRKENSQFQIAILRSEGSNIYDIYTYVYNEGYLALTTKINSKTYFLEMCYNTDKEILCTLDIGDIVMEMRLGSQNSTMMCTIDVNKTSSDIANLRFNDMSFSVKTYATPSRYGANCLGFTMSLKDGKYNNNQLEFDNALTANATAKTKYDAVKAVLTDMRG